MPDFDLTITICSWNTVEDLRTCLASLRACADEGSFEVLVVDNASFDGSPDMVEREFPEFRLLRQGTNLGFTGGHNLAVAQRRGRHAALLNSDTVVHKGSVRALLAYMEAHPEVGVVGPKLLNPDGSLQYSCRRFPNPVAAAFRNTVLGRLFPNNPYVKEYLMQDFDHTQNREVDWVSGAAMFLRAELIEKVGLLDPGYFMYCEDTDLCKRAWEAGFKVVYLPEAVVTHAIGRSTDRVANKMIVRFHKSMLRYYRKHLVSKAPAPFRPLLVAAAATALALRAGLFLAKNHMDVVRRWLKRPR
ncbi:MAG: glycosyltransferase family 2 protein [Fimbriimonadaceae bacterium]|nr:glycosyltransferase family 2 protein [Fimbriimonadaceae bacterium]QYK55412.1 MAG: glycosyltransferase family 2 protein [Fimbriimonadaceae bacterium]